MLEKLDWNKPIVFANGEPCRLLWTVDPEHATASFNCTRVVHRICVEAQASIWFYKEDGGSNWPGYQIVNQTENTIAK